MHKLYVSLVVGLVSLAGWAVLAAAPVLAATLYVDDNSCPATGSGTQASPYCSIQTALSAAQPGDTVLVSPGVYKERVEMPRAGTSSALTGTVTCTNGSVSISGSGTKFLTEVKIGHFIRCRDGHGFRWAEVSSVNSDTSLSLKTVYTGQSATGTADVGRFIQLLGQSGNPDDVRIDGYDERPSSVAWRKLEGYQNIWYYDSTGVTGTWSDPQGFHEWRTDTNYTSIARDNGADPYMYAQDNACPWGSQATALQGMDKVSGTWTKQGTRVYVHTRNHQDPNTIAVRASRIKEYQAALTSSQPYVIVKNLATWGGAKHSMRPTAMNRSMFIGASNALYENLRGYNGIVYWNGMNGLTDTTFRNFKAMMKLTPPTSPSGSAGFSGLLMENIEARGGASNVSSNDGLWGVSSSDRVILRNWYVHAGFSHKESSDCGEGNNFDWRNDQFLNYGDYDGPHGLYMGSQSVGQPTRHMIIENSIFEMNYDGLGIFHGQGGSDIIIRNNMIGLGGKDTERLMLGSTNNPGSVVLRNNIFYQENFHGRDDWNTNGGIWTYGSSSYLDSNYNLFHHPAWSGARNIQRVPNVRGYTLAQAQAEGRELNSKEIMSGSHYFVDGSLADGTPSDFHLLVGSPAINAGDPSNCSSIDRDGNTRSDGKCDIGPYEYNGGGQNPGDTQAPTVPTNVSASAVSAHQVNLTWTASTDNTAVTGYNILRSTTNGSGYAKIGTSGSTSYTDTSAAANTTYYYVTQAYDAAGNTSGNSNQASATTPPEQQQEPDTTAPSIPTNLAASAVSSSQINLTWTASTDNIGVTGYNILRSTTNGSGYTKVGTSASTSYSDTGLTANTTYYYVVQAYDAANNTSGNSNQASATTSSDTVPKTFSVTLSAVPSFGKAPLRGVDLVARVSDKANNAAYTYTFYCNRNDDSKEITPDFQKQVKNVKNKTNKAVDLCTYQEPGWYFPKVIVQKGAEAQTYKTRVYVFSSLSLAPENSSQELPMGLSSVFKRSLAFGSRGKDVAKLQDMLKQLGLISPDVKSTGYYGWSTLQGVREFQKQSGILGPAPSWKNGFGIFGTKTRNTMAQVLEAFSKM